MTEHDYDELDSGIREVVRILREAGFATTDSGDGLTKFKEGEGMECALSVPNVFIVHPTADKSAFEAAGRCQEILDSKFPGEGWWVELSWSPTDKVVVISCLKFEDSDERT